MTDLRWFMVHTGHDDVEYWYPDAVAVGARDSAEALLLGQGELLHIVDSPEDLEVDDLTGQGADPPTEPGVTFDPEILRRLRWQEEPGARRCDWCDLAPFESLPGSTICDNCGLCADCAATDPEPCDECRPAAAIEGGGE